MFWFSSSISLFLAGAILGGLTRRTPSASNYLAHLPAAAGSALAVLTGLGILLGGSPIEWPRNARAPFAPFHITVDGLGAFFVAVIGLVALAASIYSLGYVREHYSRGDAGFLGSSFNLFVLSMILVVSVSDGLGFLVVWELMTLVSYLLVAAGSMKGGTQDLST